MVGAGRRRGWLPGILLISFVSLVSCDHSGGGVTEGTAGVLLPPVDSAGIPAVDGSTSTSTEPPTATTPTTVPPRQRYDDRVEALNERIASVLIGFPAVTAVIQVEAGGEYIDVEVDWDDGPGLLDVHFATAELAAITVMESEFRAERELLFGEMYWVHLVTRPIRGGEALHSFTYLEVLEPLGTGEIGVQEWLEGSVVGAIED